MVSKTRDKLMDVARQLFAKKGIENTTMIDIANASEKGRRTIYTYFKNKSDIYDALIEHESEQLVMNLRKAVEAGTTPLEQVRAFIRTRLEIVKSSDHATSTSPSSYDRFRSIFNRNLARIAKIRAMAAEKENSLLRQILEHGVKSGDFDPEQARCFPSTLVIVMQGMYFSYVNDNFKEIGLNIVGLEEKIESFLLNGLMRRDPLPADPADNR